ncbi:MAG: DUF3606 domain-containing protein [Daejeonella sp.]|uniref:DUF3606 domain-containing protein n=1 Tax=Daejeonella sp. JGW-45 TaxID=3034148 RepID=UPI0023EB071D|nr:DUF3606 domain-containing protein [Daejeonella sp. JGW-45]
MKNHIHTRSVHNDLKPASRYGARLACIEQRYGVTSEQIRKIIAQVGSNPEKVEEYLKAKLFSFLSYTHN